MTFEGPGPELWERYSRATQAPVIMALGEGVVELNQRVAAVHTFAQLSAADRELIEAAELEISSGLSPTLQDPADWAAGSDWAAEDAALGLEPGAAPEAKSLESLPAADEGDWIGL